jgi:hypothetical protein
MPHIAAVTKIPEQTITAGSINDLFTQVEAATDGSDGYIDTTNVRDGAITTQHIGADAVHAYAIRSSSGSVTSGTTRSSGDGGVATSWTALSTLSINGGSGVALADGDVLRYHFYLLIGDVETSGGSTTKAQQLYYLRVVAVANDGGSDFFVTAQAPLGYGLANRSGNDASTSGSNGDTVAAWCRNAVSGIIVNRTEGRVYKSIILQFVFNVNDHATVSNDVDTCHCSGYAVIERA